MSNIDAWNNCDINKPSSLKRLVSKWFPDTVLIDNYESKSYKSLRLFKSKYRFQVDSKYDKDKYTKAKIDQFIKDLQNIWHKDNTQLRYYLKLFMPDVYLKQCGKSKKLYRFVTKQ